MLTLQQLTNSILIAVAVAYATHHLTGMRDLKNRRREQRIAYLIETYHIFSSICNRERADNDANIPLVERAVASIKLLGSLEQVRLVQELEQHLKNDGEMSIGDLLMSLRNGLRKELGLDPAVFDTPPLHISASRTQD